MTPETDAPDDLHDQFIDAGSSSSASACQAIRSAATRPGGARCALRRTRSIDRYVARTFMSPSSAGVEHAPGQSFGDATSFAFGPCASRYRSRAICAAPSSTAITAPRRLQNTPSRFRSLLTCRAMFECT